MPTYVYKCDSCGVQFEKVQSFKDDPIRTCPVCSEPVRKVFQPVGIVFKGSGWYVTDSRKSTSATVDAKDDAKGDGKGDTKGDKAETKTDTSDTKTETKTDKPDAPNTPAPSAPATPAPSTPAPSTT